MLGYTETGGTLVNSGGAGRFLIRGQNYLLLVLIIVRSFCLYIYPKDLLSVAVF